MQRLFADGEAVERLLNHPGLAPVLRLIEAQREADLRTLTGRLLASKSEYARLTGRLDGLDAFTSAAHAIVAHAQKTLAEQQRKHEDAPESA